MSPTAARDTSSYPLIPLTARTLRRCEVTAIASLYFPLEHIDNAVNVAQIESGWNTAAWNNSGEDSRGLWQINVVEAAHPQYADYNLFDPQVCGYFAAIIWRASGWAAWYNAAKQLGLI